MTQEHKYSISDLENCYPFERDIYVGLLNLKIQEEIDEEMRRKGFA